MSILPYAEIDPDVPPQQAQDAHGVRFANIAGQAEGFAGTDVTGQVASWTYPGTTVRYRIEAAGQTLTGDDPEPARRPILTGTLILGFDPSRLRVWAANPAESGLLQPGP